MAQWSQGFVLGHFHCLSTHVVFGEMPETSTSMGMACFILELDHGSLFLFVFGLK